MTDAGASGADAENGPAVKSVSTPNGVTPTLISVWSAETKSGSAAPEAGKSRAKQATALFPQPIAIKLCDGAIDVMSEVSWSATLITGGF